jgi:flagellar basal body rod protein FlgB
MINDDLTIQFLTRSMDLQKMKHYVSAYNVANINSPDKKFASVNFDDYLASLQQATYSGEQSSTVNELEASLPSIEYSDSINVSIDKEIRASDEAEGKYTALAELVKRNIGFMMLGIKGNV